jgi:protein TonB
MFDLITNRAQRPLRERAPRSKFAAIAIHATVFAIVARFAIMSTNPMPVPSPLPSVLAFVAAPSLPSVPGGAPAARRTKERPPATRTAPTSTDARAELSAKNSGPAVATSGATSLANVDDGVLGVQGAADGGIQSGVAGDVAHGVTGLPGGLARLEPLPAPGLRASGPVRITGQMTVPTLIHRVAPVYPAPAAEAHVTGLVILEVVVDTRGEVESTTVLRSADPLLDAAAVQAVRQWRYSPLFLNGLRSAFIVTVTLTFSASP